MWPSTRCGACPTSRKTCKLKHADERKLCPLRRLCLAPLLESLIAVDRLLFIRSALDEPTASGSRGGIAALIPL
eukprot:SAG11_NODE_37105_length_258_cov_0.968553_1_plen_73_part_10